jgi:hypothetical protein
MLVFVLDPDGNSHDFTGATPDSLVTILPPASGINIIFIYDGITLYFFVDSYCLGGVPMGSLGTVTDNRFLLMVTTGFVGTGFVVSGIQFNGQT